MPLYIPCFDGPWCYCIQYIVYKVCILGVSGTELEGFDHGVKKAAKYIVGSNWGYIQKCKPNPDIFPFLLVHFIKNCMRQLN